MRSLVLVVVIVVAVLGLSEAHTRPFGPRCRARNPNHFFLTKTPQFLPSPSPAPSTPQAIHKASLPDASVPVPVTSLVAESATPAPESSPAVESPTPVQDSPVEESPVPEEESPVSTEETPTSEEESPAPAEESPAPTEESPVPTEENPVPEEESPVPTEEESPVPEEESPAPAEESPMSTMSMIPGMSTVIPAAVKLVCHRTTYPDECESSLKPYLSAMTSRDASPAKVLEYMIKAAKNETIDAVAAFKKMASSPSPDLKPDILEQLKSCASRYKGTTDYFDTALEGLANKDIPTTQINLSGILDDYESCGGGDAPEDPVFPDPQPWSHYKRRLVALVDNCLDVCLFVKF